MHILENMAIDLTAKSKELKEYVSQFETTKFLGDISMLIQFIRFDNPISTLQGLSSPQRQLLYLVGLNISSSQPNSTGLKQQYSDEDFNHIKSLLQEVEEGYQQFFYPKPAEIIDEEWKQRRKVAMPTFLSYFNQGLLNYDEQIIERINQHFTPFDQKITEHFGLSVQDHIEIYNYIDSIPNEFLNEKINKKPGQQTWEEFANEMIGKRLMPDQWQKHLPEHFDNLFNWMSDQGSMFRFTRQQLKEKFGEGKTDAFLKNFTCLREESSFLYYTEKNPIYYKPIFKVDDNLYQAVEMNQIVQSIYNRFLEFCISTDLKEPFYKVRGQKLEEKIDSIFRKFFKGKAFAYKGYYTQTPNEQDLLYLCGKNAFIVEAKASKRDEPRRDPEKAYPLIISNFEETIQKGYDQAYRVKSKFLNRETLEIYSDQEQQNHVIDIRTKNYQNVFSVVVTLERFGQIQRDLSELLEINNDDVYPWSVCIDDLESFLLLLEKKKMQINDLVKFLLIREKLHSRLISADELDVCGAFVTGELTIKDVNSNESVFVMPAHLANIFDVVYKTEGLGFANEKNLETKTSGKYLPIGGY